MRKNDVKTLCRLALLTAVYVLLSLTLTVKTGNLEITFKSLPVVIGAILFGPAAGVLVALIGEFMSQLLTYGIMPTTVLWLLPPMARGLVIGSAAALLQRRGSLLERQPVLCYGVCLVGSVVTSCVTTVSLWLDSLIFGYYSFAFVFGSSLVRFGKDLITVAIITTLAIPVIHLLRRNGITALRSVAEKGARTRKEL